MTVVDFFVYTSKNAVFCIRYFSKTKHKSAKKKYWTMFFNGIAVQMQKFGQIRAKSKNGLKFDIGRLCSQPFNCFIENNQELLLHVDLADFTLQEQPEETLIQCSRFSTCKTWYNSP